MEVAIVLNSPTKILSVDEKDVIFVDKGYENKKYLSDKNTLAVIGDFDTLKFFPNNENIIQLDCEKDFTDGERAVYYAKEIGAKKITIYGATEGKIEHVLGNINLLAIAKKLGIEAKIKDENKILRLLEKNIEINVEKNKSLSLLPFTDECLFLKSDGLYYPLVNLTLTKSDTRGISNITTKERVRLSIDKGICLMIYYS